MTALSADRETARKDAGLKSYPVAGSTTIYKGGMVCIDADGYAIPAADTAGLKFAGVAYEQADNASGSDGDEDVRVFDEGYFKLAASSIAQTQVGDEMYVVDDQTFDETTSNSVSCGKLVEYVSATEGWLDIGAGVRKL
jgi:hypothetical protein